MDGVNLEPLLHWIREREHARSRKTLGVAPPWTDDPIIAKYRFCNVRRRDDRVSRWLATHVLTPDNLNKAGLNSFIMFTALCRWINWPPTILAIMEAGLWPRKHIDWFRLRKVMAERKTNKQKVWTGAYMITARGAKLGQAKAEFIVDDVLRGGLGKILPRVKAALESNSKQGTWEVLTTRKNWGSFMAGQVVDDWSWTPLLWHARDNFSWAPQGPGSVRGLNRLLGRPLRQRFAQDEWCKVLQEIRNEVVTMLGHEFRSITLHDLQNCMCELDKYLRVKGGEGKPRSVYRPETEYVV